MKILLVPDVPNWAIGQLANKKVKYNPHLDIKIHCVHPRDAGEKSKQKEFIDIVNSFDPDIIHFEYFRSCSQLLDALPELKSRKILLTHHNQKDRALGTMDWFQNGVDYISCFTNKCKEKLVDKYGQPEKFIKVINHGIDLGEFEYSDKEPEEKTVGYVGRIVPWKGLKEIARACKELGYKVQFMGKQDKIGYWKEILDEGLEDVIDMSFYDVPDEERKEAYNNMTIYCGNSEDGLEEGPLGYLEAMASGVPVVTTLSGVARDIARDGENASVVPFNDYEKLKESIKTLMEDEGLRKKLRKGGWETVKNMSDERMAYQYSNLYYEINGQGQDLASIILPFTSSRIMQVNDLLGAIEKQSYENIEVILANDSSEDLSEMIDTWRKTYKMPLKYVRTNNDGYGLAQARNMASIEAEGEYLVFLDSRLKPEEDVVEMFVNSLASSGSKVWIFGEKGGKKATFVENFSAVRREDYFTFGMCNERIDGYGGMSQDIRTRWGNQGGSFVYAEDITCEQIKKASKDSKRRKEISDMKLKLYKMYKNDAR